MSTFQAGTQIIDHLIWDIFEGEKGLNNATGTAVNETVLGWRPRMYIYPPGKPVVCFK